MAVTLPPLDLSVEVTLADGTRKRWDSGAAASDRPQGLQFRTRKGDGFSDASCTLARRLDTEYIDLNLLDDVAFVGDDGATAYEGRVMGMPRSFGDGQSVSVTCAGWMSHARDRKFSEIYVDRDLGAWGSVPLQRQANLAATFRFHDWQAATDTYSNTAAIVQKIQLRGGANPISETWYAAPPGVAIGALYYNAYSDPGSNVTTADALWNVLARLSDDENVTSADLTANLVQASAGPSATGYLAATTATRHYALIHFYYNGTATASADFDRITYWRFLSVYGNHGLTRRGADPGGFFASDVIKDIANRFCPELSTAGVQATSYPIPHLVFKDPTDPYDGFLEVNKFHLWDIGVWENKTLTYRPYDLSDYDWEVRLSDLGIQVDLQGDSADDVANGIAINYTEVATSRPARITPDDDASLADTSTSNPVNTHGLTKWTEYALSSPTTGAAAVQIGRIALAEFNSPKAPGTIKIIGHIKDRAGHWQQGWKVRAGDTVAITDHPNDRPRLITETTWDHDAKTLTISVEGPAHRLDAVIDRITNDLTAANLNSH